MSDTKIIAVVGATGAQGGGLARALLADPDEGFALRAITRDPSSDRARALSDAGAEVKAFVRYEVGEGIEKKVEDFAAEVASQLNA